MSTLLHDEFRVALAAVLAVLFGGMTLIVGVALLSHVSVWGWIRHCAFRRHDFARQDRRSSCTAIQCLQCGAYWKKTRGMA